MWEPTQGEHRGSAVPSPLLIPLRPAAFPGCLRSINNPRKSSPRLFFPPPSLERPHSTSSPGADFSTFPSSFPSNGGAVPNSGGADTAFTHSLSPSLTHTRSAFKALPAQPSHFPFRAGRCGRQRVPRVGTARFSTARLGSARLGSVQHGTARFNTARHGSARFNTARLGLTRLGTV